MIHIPIEKEIYENGEFKFTEEIVSFDNLNDFNINELMLETELAQAANVLSRYAEAMANIKAQVARNKTALERKYAVLALDYRVDKSEKMTNDKVREKVINHPEYQKLQDRFVATEGNEIKLETLYKTMIKKIDCLIALSYTRRQELKTLDKF